MNFANEMVDLHTRHNNAVGRRERLRGWIEGAAATLFVVAVSGVVISVVG